MPIKRANQSGMDEELLRKIINEAVADLINKEYMGTLIDKLKSNIEEVVIMKITEATEPLNNKISTLEKKLHLYKAHMDQLEIKQDDAVQYSKRSCLRVFGVPLPNNDNETESDYRDIARKMFSEMNISIPEDGIDRIHRVGRKYKRADGIMEQENFETVWIEVDNKNGTNFLFCCVYRHPNTDIDEFSVYFQTTLPKLTNKQVFIMGDFNINLLNYESHPPTNEFINNFFCKNFQPCIHHPTRISDNSLTVIDTIFTNVTATILSGNILTQISDHLPQFLILKNKSISHFSSKSSIYDYSSFDETSFINDFRNIDFSYLNNSLNIELSYDAFLKDITELVDRHVPSRKCTRKELRFRNKPWINKRIQKMIKIRDRIF